MIRLFGLLFVFISCSVSSNTLLILGDSLSAGYQMEIEQSWPSLLPEQLQKQGYDYRVINASISGDTTGNGLARLPKLLEQHQPQWVLIALGGNDGLRGFPAPIVTKNIHQMITLIQQMGSKAMLMQAKAPPNYGQRYVQSFEQVFPQAAKQFNIPLLPFFLEQIITKSEWMRNDGIHPNEKAQPWIANTMAVQLAKHLTPSNE
ncbi:MULTISPECIES: multifunctional acyl-CoA thioesterase I/protease I/lysophospholipase L1 [unclassified Vibrio]|uniref:Multifunctional acyl-CoA thioesterase I/protease I/lysophospholipase L1 n=1 Tax=Vibrio sp. HB236076 TaxID=3232307 RepID=A0AB39HI09_9VIBR|nr:multifunctional acyl-CoA thioesterase I/protease I/lysophospholipase L1 [Vibrio sp. HB161653]MDP5254977.1 multifunctional acyl-CoA thioesterase I/protease I/lysophospholipase L1 [Vibrio sp. HB161653]